MTENIQTYKKNQILLSSGRLIFNSRSESIFLSSNKYINFSAKEKVTIDVGPIGSKNIDNIFLVNAPKIQFGLDKYGVVEEVVKSKQLESILNQILDSLSAYADMIQAASIVPGPTMSVLLTPATSFLKGRFEVIRKSLETFRSEITYTI
jgi:hypothetical protein